MLTRGRVQVVELLCVPCCDLHTTDWCEWGPTGWTAPAQLLPASVNHCAPITNISNNILWHSPQTAMGGFYISTHIYFKPKIKCTNDSECSARNSSSIIKLLKQQVSKTLIYIQHHCSL